MKKTVIVIPGILGSAIGFSNPLKVPFSGNFRDYTDVLNTLYKYVWPNPTYLSTDGWKVLTLAPNGVDPKTFEFGMPLVADTLIPGFYTALIATCAKFGPTIDFPFDWRLSVSTSAQLLAAKITALPDDTDVYMVGHSMGGLLARLAWSFLAPAVRARVQRIVTLGTPHFGSYGAVLSEYGLGPVVDSVLLLASFGSGIGREVHRKRIIPALQSFPGLACLFPSRQTNSPDPWRASSAKAWNLAWYGTSAQTLSQTVLDAADIFQASLPTNEPRDLIACVVGVGFDTVDGNPTFIDGPPEEGRLRAFDHDGDGLVEPWSATYPPGAPTLQVPVAHQALIEDARVLTRIADLLENGVQQQSTPGGFPNPPGKGATLLPLGSYPMQPLDP